MNTNNKPLLNPTNRSQIKDAIKNYIVEHIDEICEELPDVISEDAPQKHPVIVDGGVYRIVNWHSRSVISVKGNSTARRVQVILLKKDEGNKSQLWKAVKVFDGKDVFAFENTNSRMFLDVENANLRNLLWQYEYNATRAQLFRVIRNNDGTVFLCSGIKDDYKISVHGGSHYDGAQIGLKREADSGTKWLLERVS